MATIKFEKGNIEIACRAFRAAGFFGCPRNYQSNAEESQSFNLARREFGLKCSAYDQMKQDDYSAEQLKALVDLAYAYMEEYNIEVRSYLSPISRFRYKV